MAVVPQDQYIELKNKYIELEVKCKALEEKVSFLYAILVGEDIPKDNFLKNKSQPQLLESQNPVSASQPTTSSIVEPMVTETQGNKDNILPFPKVSIKSLNPESLHVFTDYGAEIVLLHGYNACIDLKDAYLKPIGFRFSNELPFGAGWTGNKGHYLKLREEMKKKNSTIPIEEYLMVQITK